MVLIRPWTQADIGYVTTSVNREGWGYTQQDIARCWQYEPNGCFIAEVQNKPVGHVFSICYGKMGWIGLLIVEPEKRVKGIGTALMHATIDYLQNVGAETIRLEAVEKAVPLYRRLGFREEFDSVRFRKQLKRKEKLKPFGENIFHIQEEDIRTIAEFDSKCFGANRLRVLQSLHKGQPRQCFVAKEKQKVLGYIIIRKILNAHRIGPWVCATRNTAEKLLNACLNTIEEEETELRLGMPILNKHGMKLMQKLGFNLVSESVRMFLGKNKHRGEITRIYGIGGPEKG